MKFKRGGKLMPENPDLPGLGQRLRQAREDAGLSQAQAAKLLGLHRPAITEIEAESRKVSAGELKDFALLYHVSTSWLLGEPIKVNEQLKMAARNLESLKAKDLETVMRVIDSFRRE
jgi:transcriptional regulator with XRE-family HTH domain